MNNTIILEDCIDDFIAQNELTINKQDSFELFSMLQITKESDTSFEEIENSVVDGGLDGGIDSFLFLINDKAILTEDQLEEVKFTEKTEVKIYISQAKFERSFKEEPINKLQSTVPLLLNLELAENDLLVRFNSNLVEKCMLFRQIWRSSIRKRSKISLVYTYSSRANEVIINGSFQSKVEQLVNYTKSQTNFSDVSFNLYSSKELLEIHQQSNTEELELKFKENPIPIPFKENEFGYVGVVNLNDYYKFITDENSNIRENIFENNIRHYQGDVDVNTNISRTLSTDFNRDFWWLNNGITIIASSCRPILKTLFLDDVQIVNGLQTSYTVNKHFNQNETDLRSVLVKVITTNEKQTIDKIISASNSQNPVPPALLRATDDIQRAIETYCLNKGYFYDRRKNYYKNKQKPTSKIISIQNMAQAIEAILNYSPANARSKPTSLIKEKKSYKLIFDEKKDFGAFLNSAIIYKKVANFINKNIAGDEKSVARNFAYHISRITTSIILNSHEYSDVKVSTISEEQITEETIEASYQLLIKILEEYNEKSPNENIINVSKSNGFTKMLNEKMKAYYTTA
ncbi:AIPR family protein [Bacillus siamensis]|uniref:AIPR family protein n=1 Tax=Bacillus siamensis TaxID=659243 RepID=UPI002E1E6F96|nr:AIPR family protein [Bacillus siamensis]MED5096631.1 AIPR family protein [Bacillus siamensis]